ncbi:MAG: hypothetical protein LBV17_09015 [Treponema sp.]|jgi:hypothetical protein|nr:hypothetical protein [Treponema sp.]
MAARRTEEQQKDHIFDIFTKCRSETAPARLQAYYPSLCEQVFIWYRDYLPVDADGMGLEIAKVISRFIKSETISGIPQDKDGFFRYLVASIKREKAGSRHEYNENETIRIPKEKRRKLREVEDFIRMKESQLGRKLTNNERIHSISKWFKNHEYVDLLKVKNVGGISAIINNEDKEKDVLDSKANSIYHTNITNDPLDEYIRKTDMETQRKALESALGKKQERSRDCYRALFTLHYIENNKNFEELYSVLDKDVIEACQDGKNPSQYEIYQKYHPKAQKSSAEAMASKNLGEFLNDIEICLKK